MKHEPPRHFARARVASCHLCGGTGQRLLIRKRGHELVACTDCGLAYLADPLDAAGVAALYTGDDYHAALLDPGHPEFAKLRATARQHLRFLTRSVPDPRGLRLLDVGCSSGLFLAEARAAGFAVHGAELSPATAGFARDRFGLAVHTGDWREAGHAEASFDVITLFDVVEHLADPTAELAALRRLLKPGGLLLQSTPNLDGLFPRVSQRVAQRLDYWPHPEPPHHLYQFSTATLTTLTERAGYRVTRADLTAIGYDYNFGTPYHWRRSPKMLAYALAFAPVALLGQWLGMGDWLYLAARRID